MLEAPGLLGQGVVLTLDKQSITLSPDLINHPGGFLFYRALPQSRKVRTQRAWVETHPRDLLIVEGWIKDAVEKRMREPQREIRWAKTFKSEQDAAPDLPHEQMAANLLAVLPDNSRRQPMKSP